FGKRFSYGLETKKKYGRIEEEEEEEEEEEGEGAVSTEFHLNIDMDIDMNMTQYRREKNGKIKRTQGWMDGFF
ncbi:MAG: hypothetical protein Q9191_001767, partial [Dirinaria sp. TL-2023a]